MVSIIANRLIGEADEVPLPPGYSHDEMADFVDKALRPYLRITFLDGGKESIQIGVKWIKNAYTTGSHWHPGLQLLPTPEQLDQIGGPIGGQSGGEFAIEIINSRRYESEERSGALNEVPEEAAQMATETPEMYFRPLEYEYVNEGEPPTGMYGDAHPGYDNE